MAMRDRQKQAGRSLPSIALDVHMTTTGSYERGMATPYTQNEDIEILKEAIRTWEPSKPKYADFDNAVKNLIIAAIAEAF